MKDPIHIQTPLTKDVVKTLRAGDRVLISGNIYLGRDAVHKRFVEALNKGESLPVDLRDQIIFYTGPCPPRPGYPLGPTGPTTAYRMDPYTPQVLEQTGLTGMLSKGNRTQAVVDAIVKNCAVYFICTAGIGALLTKSIKSYEILAYPELGPEALAIIGVENFPATVGIDCQGNDFYQECKAQYARM